MKRKLSIAVALLLVLTMMLSCLAGCAPENPDPSESTSPTEGTKKPSSSGPVIITKPTEPPEALPEPLEQVPVTSFPEAFDLMNYLEVLSAADTAAWDKAFTGEQASRALVKLGVSNSGIDASAANVTGTQLLTAVVKRLGYAPADEAAVLAQAEKIHLTRGFWQFDAAANLTVEQAANILLSAMQCYLVDASGITTGEKLSDTMGVTHVVLTEYDEPFNRPGSTWISSTTGEAVTGEYTAVPLAVFGTTASYCDIMCALGFGLDDPDYDQHIPKYFRLCVDGGMLSERFWKSHNGDATDGHAVCKTDFTGGQDATMEIFALDDYEFRMVIMNTFLAVSDPYEGLVIYGFERAKYGPYTEETRPPVGVYIAHHYWNAYGMGNGYEIVGPATVVKGTLNSGNVLTTTMNGTEYENGQSYSFGKKFTTAPANAGKEYFFYLDRYGFLLGCSEEEIE